MFQVVALSLNIWYITLANEPQNQNNKELLFF